MYSLDFFDSRRERVAEYLRQEGYPVDNMPEDGISEDGYEVWLKDAGGNRIIAWSHERLKSKKYSWKNEDHWREICRIWSGSAEF